MGFGVLEDRKLDQVPGTVLLVDANEGVDAVQDCLNFEELSLMTSTISSVISQACIRERSGHYSCPTTNG